MDKEKTLKRGEMSFIFCPTPYCSGTKLRCWVCGGEVVECQCGDSQFNACICGAEAGSFRDIKLKNIRNLAFGIAKEFWMGLRYRDWWWLKNGWRGR